MQVNRRAVLTASGLSALAAVAPSAAAEDGAANVAVARRFIEEVLNAANAAAMDGIVSPDYQSQNPDDAPGLESYQTRMSTTLQVDGFSIEHLAYSIEDIAPAGADVFVRGYATGERRGKKVRAVYLAQFRFAGGLIVTDWFLRDEAAMLGL